MKNSLLLLATVLFLASCKEKTQQKSSVPTDNKPASAEYLISKDGIGELKIGMTKTELEKILKAPLAMKHANDTGEVWMDTATATYGKIGVMLYFQKQYSEKPTNEMELFGISTSSPLCKTTTGLGVGDDKSAILVAYEDNPITMGPENIMVNDTTWAFSKTNYFIHVSDDKWDKQLSFLLVNKKITSIEAMLQMGD
jgi:hypothetical protein